MFHKRLLKEFKDNMKYVVGMVATQWVSLLANVGMMLVMTSFVAELVTATMQQNRMLTLLIVFIIGGIRKALRKKK